MNMQWETLKRITAEGKREDVKVFVGGAPISQSWCDKIGADAYGVDALVSVKAKACITNLANMKGGDPELHAALLAIDTEREEAKLAEAVAARNQKMYRAMNLRPYQDHLAPSRSRQLDCCSSPDHLEP